MDLSLSIRQQDSEQLHHFSSQLWGNQDRFVVAAAVATAHPGELYAQALATAIGIPDARVGPQLLRLERLGLLVRLPKVGGERRVYFERRNDAFWAAVAAMRDAVA